MGFLDSMKANREGMKAYRMHVSALQLRQNGKHAEATAKLNEAYQLYQQAYKRGLPQAQRRAGLRHSDHADGRI